jgi:hypothetical protein
VLTSDESDAVVNALEAKVLALLTKTPRLFRKVAASEDNSVRLQLDQLMQLVAAELKVVSEDSLKNLIATIGGFCLASKKSRPEPAVVWESFILMASEAKGFDSSALKCMTQGSQVAGDGALLLKRAGLDIGDCVVPGVFAFSDCLQFYACHLLPDRFPVFSLLSHPISVASRVGRREIAAWFVLLQKFLAATVDLLKASKSVIKSGEDGIQLKHPPLTGNEVAMGGVTLNVSKLFVKPVRLRLWDFQLSSNSSEVHPYRIAMTHTLEIFRALWNCEASRPFINFPLGWLQVPGHENRTVRDLLNKKLERFEDCKGDNRLTPCFAFPLLLMKRILPHCDPDHTYLIIEQLETAIDSVVKAGVSHLDLRPANIMWGCACHTADASSSSSSSSSSVQHSIFIRVVDWETARFMGEVIQTSRYKDDYRYPLAYCEAADAVVENKLDLWSVSRIAAFLRQKEEMSFSKFCNAFHSELSSSSSSSSSSSITI